MLLMSDLLIQIKPKLSHMILKPSLNYGFSHPLPNQNVLTKLHFKSE